MTRDKLPAVGIDLATTYSAIAHLNESGGPETLRNSNGRPTTPSVVLFDKNEVIVGEEAVMAIASEPERVADCAKRDMGKKFYHRKIAGREYPPEVIQAYLIKKLKEDAAQLIGSFRHAVITVPAYFDEIRRKATQDAGFMAGLEVIDIINEPTAAALAFGFTEGFLDSSGSAVMKQRILVYDLGGGTFDVTLVDVDGTHFTTLATDGDYRLGGQDWDFRLVDYVADEFAKHHNADPRNDLVAISRLWRNCEEAKRSLSARQETSISCDFEGVGRRVRVTRELFEQLTQDLVDRTSQTTRLMLREAGVDWNSIDRVLLVGGSTRMPMIQKVLREISGKDPDMTVSADEAIAHGAALQAGLVIAKNQGSPPTFHVNNVNAHSLGVAGKDRQSGVGRVGVVIPRNTRLPASARRFFRTQDNDQRSILVRITEGESPSPDGCSLIGSCVVRDLPPGLPAGTPIEITFQYAANGRLGVDVKIANTNGKFEHEIVRETGLTNEQLETWRDYICFSQ